MEKGELIDRISDAEKIVVGLKQTLICLSQNQCAEVVIADDADAEFKRKVLLATKNTKANVSVCFTRAELGLLCKIDVPCGVIAII